MEILSREFIYIWYYFTVQLEQIFGWWCWEWSLDRLFPSLPRTLSTVLSAP